MFEVGKKYSKGGNNPILKCIAVANGWAMMEDPDGFTPAVRDKGSFDQYVEYKEPRSVSRWVNVWQNPNGEISIGGGHPNWKLLDTIEVKWTEK